MSVSDYHWSPSSGWVITVSVQSGQPLTPLLMGMPRIERIVEQEPEATDSILTTSDTGQSPSTEDPQTSQRRVIVSLKPDDEPQNSAGD